MYRREVPLTFGLLMDLHLKLFALQHTDRLKGYESSVFIDKMGAVQLHVKFRRGILPRGGREAENMIEDTTLKVRKAAESLVKGIWGLYPEDIPEGAFSDQDDFVTTYIFLDGKQIGYASKDNFYWKKQERKHKVITNQWKRKK
jgi:hypothetical protein